LVIALLIYRGVISRTRWARALWILAGLLALTALIVAKETIVGNYDYESDPSFFVRIIAYEHAVEAFQTYPILGWGTASHHGVSFQDLFGKDFFVADIGIVGVLLMHGLVGVALYLALLGFLCRQVMRATMVSIVATGRMDPLLSALSIVSLIFLVSLPLQAPMLSPYGAAIAAFALGLSSVYLRNQASDFRARPSSAALPPVTLGR
jgi:O-antigen ligase